MSKLRVINQPLKVSKLDLTRLDEEIQASWDHITESMDMRQRRNRRRSFKIELGR